MSANSNTNTKCNNYKSQSAIVTVILIVLLILIVKAIVTANHTIKSFILNQY